MVRAVYLPIPPRLLAPEAALAGRERKLWAWDRRLEGYTFREIGVALGISGSRARQLSAAGERLARMQEVA